MASHINKSALNTFNLLEDILMWARTQKGKIPFEPQSLSFAEIFKNILEVLKPTSDLKNITINYFAAGLFKCLCRHLYAKNSFEKSCFECNKIYKQKRHNKYQCRKEIPEM